MKITREEIEKDIADLKMQFTPQGDMQSSIQIEHHDGLVDITWKGGFLQMTEEHYKEFRLFGDELNRKYFYKHNIE